MMARGWVICWQDRIDLCLCQACFNVSFFLFQAFFLLRCVFLFFFLAKGGFWGLLVGRSFFENEVRFDGSFEQGASEPLTKGHCCSVLAIAFESLASASRLRPEKNTF